MFSVEMAENKLKNLSSTVNDNQEIIWCLMESSIFL